MTAIQGKGGREGSQKRTQSKLRNKRPGGSSSTFLYRSINLTRTQCLLLIKCSKNKYFDLCTLIPYANNRSSHSQPETHTSVCEFSLTVSASWLHQQAWNHLCRHKSINQHRKDVWHHETPRFSCQAERLSCSVTCLCCRVTLQMNPHPLTSCPAAIIIV